MNALEPLVLRIALSTAFLAGLFALQSSGEIVRNTKTFLTLICFATISIFSILQFAFPYLLPLLMRNGNISFSNQPWRITTSLLVQDGGYAGAIVNLTFLLFIGFVAEKLLEHSRWAASAVISVIAAQLAALAWQPMGAGNSILNFALANYRTLSNDISIPPTFSIATPMSKRKSWMHSPKRQLWLIPKMALLKV